MIRPRKSTGTFLTEPFPLQCISKSSVKAPSPEKRYFEGELPLHFTSASFKNFIGNTVFVEGPRAVAVTEDGEKYSIDWDGAPISASSTSPNAANTSSSLPKKSRPSKPKHVSKIPVQSSRLRARSLSNKRGKHVGNSQQPRVTTPTKQQRSNADQKTRARIEKRKTDAQTQTEENCFCMIDRMDTFYTFPADDGQRQLLVGEYVNNWEALRRVEIARKAPVKPATSLRRCTERLSSKKLWIFIALITCICLMTTFSAEIMNAFRSGMNLMTGEVVKEKPMSTLEEIGVILWFWWCGIV